jgi:acetoacetyl-CoA synthetase
VEHIVIDEPGPAAAALKSIWERTLRRSNISLDDDFFDLGGDSRAASEIFAEMNRTHRRELCPALLYEARSIAELTKALEQQPLPRIPPILRMKTGSEPGPPLFMTHGYGGNLLELLGLVRHLEWRHTIYGIQARGSDGVDEPFSDVPTMADFYVKQIRQAQPTGPYFLVGYSFGGLVMLEIARRFRKTGAGIGLLAMIDSYPHISQLHPSMKAALYARIALRRLGAMVGLSRRQVKANDRESLTYDRPVFQLVRSCTLRALVGYRPTYYEGKINFIKARTATVFPDPARVWPPMSARFEMETAPGDHHGLLESHSETSAALLSHWLSQSVKTQPPTVA